LENIFKPKTSTALCTTTSATTPSTRISERPHTPKIYQQNILTPANDDGIIKAKIDPFNINVDCNRTTLQEDDNVDDSQSENVYELCNEILNCNFNRKICDINVVSGHQSDLIKTSDGNNSLVATNKVTINSKNPFLNQNSISSKRDEFLKATMKICLVVSPPSNRLQVSRQ
jgi:hypothetical protein